MENIFIKTMIVIKIKRHRCNEKFLESDVNKLTKYLINKYRGGETFFYKHNYIGRVGDIFTISIENWESLHAVQSLFPDSASIKPPYLKVSIEVRENDENGTERLIFPEDDDILKTINNYLEKHYGCEACIFNTKRLLTDVCPQQFTKDQIKENHDTKMSTI